jgi:prepilin-type N-terminal cleavage/methylation domain-containing protein
MKQLSIAKQRGFTLIELLVVISIISLLSAVIMAGMKSAKDKAATSAFSQSFRQIQIALEQYKNDTGYYPYENDNSLSLIKNTSGDTLTSGLTTIVVNSITQKSFLPTYINKIPQFLPTSAILIFYNATFIKSYPSTYSCGGRPLKGYLFLYQTGSTNTDLNLPHYNNGFGESPTDYCITAN